MAFEPHAGAWGSAFFPYDHEMSHLEIERTYLLNGLPALPAQARAYRMEQGYLAAGAGRLRRSVAPDGTVTYTHTLKTGSGLVRRETEREISRDVFETMWPGTAGRRLAKTRSCIDDGDLVWEIDDYEGIDLVLAEVELPSPDTSVTIPHWLAAHVVRDVTDEPDYQNYEIALRMTKGRERGLRPLSDGE